MTRCVGAAKRFGWSTGPGHARVPDDVEVIDGDARDPAFTTAVTQGAAVVYQTLNPPYHEWTAQFPAMQAGVLAAEATGARLVSNRRGWRTS